MRGIVGILTDLLSCVSKWFYHSNTIPHSCQQWLSESYTEEKICLGRCGFLPEYSF